MLGLWKWIQVFPVIERTHLHQMAENTVSGYKHKIQDQCKNVLTTQFYNKI